MEHASAIETQPLRQPVFAAPQKSGAGFKPEHLADILNDQRKVGFFEVHAENYMGQGGRPHAQLQRLRDDYPIYVHGVGLSIGGYGDLDKAHLQRLADVVDRYEPLVVSEHLAWSTHDNTYFNDLLPVPYTRDVLERVISHVDQLQEALGREILLENPSTYVAFAQATMSETEFVRDIAKRTGCGLLLDLNNVFISATNHKTSAEQYLTEFPLDRVQEIHLAGHASETDDLGAPLLIDAHDRPVSAEVWALYEKVLNLRGPIATLVEWDNDVPEWSVLKAEADLADAILKHYTNTVEKRFARAS